MPAGNAEHRWRVRYTHAFPCGGPGWKCGHVLGAPTAEEAYRIALSLGNVAAIASIKVENKAPWEPVEAAS